MITAHRTHRHFNLPVRRFNIDKYLDAQLASPGSTVLREGDRLMHVHGSLTPEQLHQVQKYSMPQPATKASFRGWATRLNDRIEGWMERTDWHRVDIWLGNLGGVCITGFVVYMAYVVIDAWLQGKFNVGVN